MSGAETSDVDGLIKGNCMVAGFPLLVLFDSGATHSFVSNDCVDRLKLQTESLPFDLVVSTPTDVPVVVSTVVSRCPVVVNGRTFTVDLICLPLT
ncbi:putative aspartic peptidase domain-containing protein [Lupinus albus]|uniref:Putative aspartic peptidase domain-containing protein n=1 Tax=Lupinus albus TaxID=3870 RepID=A0A6A4PS22_LUPAL|nr:putative aspartic peptidase domain-containing protein [Lupinus albus]